MSDLWSNEYGAPAGKGTKDRKRRERLTIESIPKKIATVRKAKRKYNTKSNRQYFQKPEHETAKRKKKVNTSNDYDDASGLKAKVRWMVIDHDISFLELMDLLKHVGIPLSSLAASNIRRDTMDIMRMLEKAGVLDMDKLARRRKRLAKGDAV